MESGKEEKSSVPVGKFYLFSFIHPRRILRIYPMVLGAG